MQETAVKYMTTNITPVASHVQLPSFPSEFASALIASPCCHKALGKNAGGRESVSRCAESECVKIGRVTLLFGSCDVSNVLISLSTLQPSGQCRCQFTSRCHTIYSFRLFPMLKHADVCTCV